MTERHDHPHDELHLLLDGRLDTDAQARVEAHIHGCIPCQRELEVLRWTKRTVRGHVEGAPVPAQVTARVLAALADVDGGVTEGSKRSITRRLWAPALGFSLAAAVAIMLLVGRARVGDPVVAAGRDLESYMESTLALEHLTESPQELEQFFAAEGIAFGARVFDFGMMNFTLRGGRVHRIDGRPSALFAYSSAEGRHIVCQMYRGELSELSGGFERHVLGGIEFHLYRRGQVALVFWQEGALVCVLGYDGDPREALQLARSKAKAAGT